MKKIISSILALTMLLSCVAVLADSTASKAMEEALLLVKQKVDISEELSEFTPHNFEDAGTGEMSYTFLWQSKAGNAHVEVSCDDKGRITGYYFYDNSLKSDKKLSSLSKADILMFAESFLRKTVPEAFEGKNELVFDQETWSVDSMNYSLRYKRTYDGIYVKDNDVSVRVAVYDDVPYVRSMSLYINYDAEFEPLTADVEDFEEKYKNEFPIELVYMDEYSYGSQKDQDKNKTVLVYRHKDNEAGFILADNGEKVIEDSFDGVLGGGRSNVVAMESVQDSANRKMMFTEQELKELEIIDGLISKADAEKILKKLPYTGLDSTLSLKNSNIYSEDGKYYLSVTFESEDGERYISATFNGKSGELLNLYNRIPYNRDKSEQELSEEQKKSAETKTEEFLKAAAGEKYKEYAKQSCDAYEKTLCSDYDRMVDGVRYISDGIYAEFDTEQKIITSYRIDFEEEKNFDDSSNVISIAEAYNALLKNAPLEKVYVKTDGKYRACYTVSSYGTEIDAFTGEKYKAPYLAADNQSYEYSDIKGHWAEEKINKLAEVGIGLSGNAFRPDEPITQYDLLRLFAAGVRYKSYLNYGEEELYAVLSDEGILTKEEKAPSDKVRREDAFVYMVRLDGLEKIAKLHHIFKVDYADGHLVKSEKIGYPAILTGMGVICGNGGRLRPQDEITRAEAAVMVCNYMVK